MTKNAKAKISKPKERVKKEASDKRRYQKKT